MMSNYKLLINTSHKPNKEQTNLEGPKKKKESYQRILLINLFNLVLKRLPSANPPVRS